MSVSKSVTRKIRDPLYTTFQKIFTIIRIFLKSEAPKAPGLFTFVHRGGLENIKKNQKNEDEEKDRTDRSSSPPPSKDQRSLEEIKDQWGASSFLPWPWHLAPLDGTPRCVYVESRGFLLFFCEIGGGGGHMPSY